MAIKSKPTLAFGDLMENQEFSQSLEYNEMLSLWNSLHQDSSFDLTMEILRGNSKAIRLWELLTKANNIKVDKSDEVNSLRREVEQIKKMVYSLSANRNHSEPLVVSNNSRKLRVFLCHASQDKPVVRELYQRLNEEGLVDPWLDEKKILGGQDWDLEIQKAVRGSDVVLVGFSKEAVNKEGYIQKEIKLALDVAEEKPDGTIFIIPVRFEGCLLPSRLSKYHWVNYYEPDGYRQIIKSLQSRAISLNISIAYRIPLSDRELEVLLLLAKGKENKEIAENLRISHQTVKNHLSSVYMKLNVKTRSQAVAYAYQHGLV